MLDAIRNTETGPSIGSLEKPSPVAGIKNTFACAFNAYIYGYPLVMLGVTQQQLNNTPLSEKDRGGGAPINQFALQSSWPTPEAKAVVLLSTSTLYMIASLNLRDEPIVMDLPAFTYPADDSTQRFFIMQVLDGWTNVVEDSPGTRVGSEPGKYVFVGPHGTITEEESSNMKKVIRMATDTVWIIGRIYSDGSDADLDWISNQIYPGLTLTPLSKLGDNTYTPPTIPIDPLVDTDTAPFYQLQGMDASAFFGRLAAMLNYNPPTVDEDEEMVECLKEIGFDFGTDKNPEVSFDFSTLDQEKQVILQSALEVAVQHLEQKPSSRNPNLHFWTFPRYVFMGDYENNYEKRASIARWALGANRVEDCVYGYANQDSDGNALSGKNKYQIHFSKVEDKNMILPVDENAFWSVTIYNSDGTLVENKKASECGVDYNAIGMPPVQEHPVTVGDDDGITLYLQADPPVDDDEHANWLPIPTEAIPGDDSLGFIVFLRMYSPCLKKEKILNHYVVEGAWTPPGITLVPNS